MIIFAPSEALWLERSYYTKYIAAVAAMRTSPKKQEEKMMVMMMTIMY